MKNKIIKALTLFIFMSLISGFVAFQAGCQLMSSKKLPSKSDEKISNNIDTSIYEVVERKKIIMSSSKAYFPEGFGNVELDTIYQDTIPKR